MNDKDPLVKAGRWCAGAFDNAMSFIVIGTMFLFVGLIVLGVIGQLFSR